MRAWSSRRWRTNLAGYVLAARNCEHVTIEINAFPRQSVLLASAHSGVNRQVEFREMKIGNLPLRTAIAR